jgi:hypothetical protein
MGIRLRKVVRKFPLAPDVELKQGMAAVSFEIVSE